MTDDMFCAKCLSQLQEILSKTRLFGTGKYSKLGRTLYSNFDVMCPLDKPRLLNQFAKHGRCRHQAGHARLILQASPTESNQLSWPEKDIMQGHQEKISDA